MVSPVLTDTVKVERPYISKSKFLSGNQCKKLLWHAYNKKDQIPEPDAAQQAIFEQVRQRRPGAATRLDSGRRTPRLAQCGGNDCQRIECRPIAPLHSQ